MSGDKFILFSLIVVASYSLTCPTYVCGTEKEPPNCVNYNLTTNQYVLTPCTGTNSYCKPTV